MKFFAESGKYPAAGLFSFEHFLMIVLCLLVLSFLIIKTFKNRINNPNKVVKIVSIIVLIMEISKVIWGTEVGRYANWYNYLPLWFCSLFIPLSLLAGFTKGKLQQLSLTFLFYGGIVGGVAYLIFPTTSIGRYPIFHFITFHSMFYHMIMIYMGFFVVYYKLITPHIRDLRGYVLITSIFCVISYIVNYYLGTNYMFLTNYSNNPILEILYYHTGKLYPLILSIGQNFGTFFVSLGGYVLFKFFRKEELKKDKVI